MDIKCRVCLASSEVKLYHSLTAVFPVYFKTNSTVLNILQSVTQSTVLVCPDWPKEICTACLKLLKECYIFIQDFHKAQNVLKNTIFANTEEEIILKIEPPNEDYSEDDPLYSKSENNGDISYPKSEIKLGKPISKQNNVEQKVLDKTSTTQMCKKLTNIKKSRRCNINSSVGETLEFEENKFDARDSEHNYTKYSDCKVDFGEDSEESEDSNLTSAVTDYLEDTYIEDTYNNKNLKETRIISNEIVPSKQLVQSEKSDKIVVLTVKDFSNIKRTPKRQSPAFIVQSKLRERKIIPSQEIQAKSDPLKALVTRRIQNRTRKLVQQGQVFKCNLCLKAFSTPKGLLLHKQIHTPEYMAELKCKHCGQQSRTKSGFIRHRQKHYRNTYESIYGEELPEGYTCSECGKKFKYNHLLKYHISATHHKKDKDYLHGGYLCDFCGYICFTKAKLKRHECCHTDERPHKCKLCLKSFKTSTELQAHYSSHEQNKNYCKFCGKGFATAWNMKVHWLQHTYGSYRCDQCFRTFPDETVLQFHYSFRHKIKGKTPENYQFVDNENINSKLENTSESD